LIIMDIAILQNSFASKLLDINKDQMLIDTGLYAHVRHPLYAGAVLMVLTIPIALGCWWALIPAAVAILTLVARIKPEEEMLIRGMDGYEAYRTRVRYKLIPKIY
jgi:protein-S-isoprenylcysteine O-methyltransferase Ste14